MKPAKLACLLVLLLLSAPSAQQRAAAPSPAAAKAAGFSVERLGRIDAALQQYVDDKRAAGIVALVLRDGRPVYQKAVGWSDQDAGRRMEPNTIFRIASQTKAITSVAILQLAEE